MRSAGDLSRREFINGCGVAAAGLVGLGAALTLPGCAPAGSTDASGATDTQAGGAGGAGAQPDTGEAPQAEDPQARPSWSDPDAAGALEHAGNLALRWARGFTVDLYEGGYALACIADGTRYLFVPQGQDAPDGMAEGVVVLERPARDIYLASSSTLCLFAALEAVDNVSFASVTQDSCTVQAFSDAIGSGQVAYGGKYSSPDYEAFVGGACRLAVENTMIYHTPEVREKLIELGVPVIVEQSSLEGEPLGRLEWILLWGALLDKSDLAQQVLDEQANLVAQVQESVAKDPCDRRVAFFYINANGAAVVRKPGDYMAKMIALAGGTYAFDALEDPDAESRTSSVTMEMEAFYAQAKDADAIVYNSTVAGQLRTLADLVALNPLLADFKAVRQGQAWCCEQNVYQQMTSTGEVVAELHEIIAGTEKDRLDYLFRLV